MTGCVITIIGLSLLPVAIRWMMGGNNKAPDWGSVENISLALLTLGIVIILNMLPQASICLLYTSDAADEGLGVDLGGRRIIKKKKRGEGWREGVGGGARRQSGSERLFCFFFQAEDGIRDLVRSRGLGDVYKRQDYALHLTFQKLFVFSHLL